jgi:hypothetical protein
MRNDGKRTLFIVEGVHEFAREVFTRTKRPQKLATEQWGRGWVCAQEARRTGNDFIIQNGEVQRHVVSANAPTP